MDYDSEAGDAAAVVRSMLRFSWSLSLLGARQAGALLVALGTARPADPVRETFDAVSKVTEKELGETLGDFFRTGWNLQERAIDAFFDVAGPAIEIGRGLASTTFLWGSLETGRRSLALFDAALPESVGLGWRELGNKLAAFEDFQYAHRILDLFDDLKLAEALGRADALGSRRRLWALEGLGYAFAESAWRDGSPPRGLLSGRRLDAVPRAGWLPLHTGLGLSLARRRLHRLDSRRDAEEVAAAVQEHLELCDANARAGFRQAVFESLGLVVRQLDPAAAAAIDRELERHGREARALFWHGTGRGLYFLPSLIYPGSLPRAFELARSEPPHALGRHNAVAGLAWAFTLVNFCNPEIVEAFVARSTADWNADDQRAFGHGAASAYTFWLDASGGDAADQRLRAFREHRPENGESHWHRLVVEPCRAALERYPVLEREARIGEIFRHLEGSKGTS